MSTHFWDVHTTVICMFETVNVFPVQAKGYSSFWNITHSSLVTPEGTWVRTSVSSSCLSFLCVSSAFPVKWRALVSLEDSNQCFSWTNVLTLVETWVFDFSSNFKLEHGSLLWKTCIMVRFCLIHLASESVICVCGTSFLNLGLIMVFFYAHSWQPLFKLCWNKAQVI